MTDVTPISNFADLSTVRVSRRMLLGGGIAALGGISGIRGAMAEPLLSYKTIDRIIDRMTLEEKLGQMFIIQVNGTDMTDWYRNLLLEIQPGGVLFFGFNVGSFEQVRNYINAIQRTGRYAPPLIAVDQEGGPVARVPGDPVPGANQLGQMSDKEVRKILNRPGQVPSRIWIQCQFCPGGRCRLFTEQLDD